MKTMSEEERERRYRYFRMICALQKKQRLELIEQKINPELVRPDLGKMTQQERELLYRNCTMTTFWNSNTGVKSLDTFNEKIGVKNVHKRS